MHICRSVGDNAATSTWGSRDSATEKLNRATAASGLGEEHRPMGPAAEANAGPTRRASRGSVRRATTPSTSRFRLSQQLVRGDRLVHLQT
jgi:hypothetical protein